MASKDRYLSREEYRRYEKLKNEIRAGKLLTPESLRSFAQSVDNDPTRLGQLVLNKIEQFVAEDPHHETFSDNKLPIKSNSKEYNDEEDFLPYIGFDVSKDI